MDLRQEYFPEHFQDCGRLIPELFIQAECQAADSDAVLRRTAGKLPELDEPVGIKGSGGSGVQFY